MCMYIIIQENFIFHFNKVEKIMTKLKNENIRSINRRGKNERTAYLTLLTHIFRIYVKCEKRGTKHVMNVRILSFKRFNDITSVVYMK